LIPAKRAHLYTAAASHSGKKRSNNEDRYAVSAHRLGEKAATPSLLAVLCDGVGGHRAGEVAAEIAVEKISAIIAASDGSQPVDILSLAIQRAAEAVSAQAQTSPELNGMGATCVCAWVIGERLYAAWMGDSRLYLWRGGRLQKLSIDHTWVQEALDHGALTPEQARNHPNAHVIHRYLGSRHPTPPDVRLRLSPEESDEQAEANQGLHLQPGDCLLLCSDGLTDMLNDEDIQEVLQTHSRQKAVDVLLHQSLERGGHDNITIVLLEMPDRSSQSRLPSAQTGQRRAALTCALVAFLGGLVLLAGAALTWYLVRQPLVKPTATPTSAPLILPTGGPSATLPGTSLSPTAADLPDLPPMKVTATPPSGPTRTPWPTNTLPPTGQPVQASPPPVLTVAPPPP